MPATTTPGPQSPVPKRPYRTDPKKAHDKAVNAARARTTPDYYIDAIARLWPELTPGQLDRIRRLAEAAPPLSDETRRQLRELLEPYLAEPAPSGEDRGRGAA